MHLMVDTVKKAMNHWHTKKGAMHILKQLRCLLLLFYSGSALTAHAVREGDSDFAMNKIYHKIHKIKLQLQNTPLFVSKMREWKMRMNMKTKIILEERRDEKN